MKGFTSRIDCFLFTAALLHGFRDSVEVQSITTLLVKGGLQHDPSPNRESKHAN
jgi:hypothetical protein